MRLLILIELLLQVLQGFLLIVFQLGNNGIDLLALLFNSGERGGTDIPRLRHAADVDFI